MPDHMPPAPIAASTTAVTLTATAEVTMHGFALAEKAAATRRVYQADPQSLGLNDQRPS